MKKSIYLILFVAITSCSFSWAQELEVEGKLKVTDMPLDNNVQDIVVQQPDGTLGTRQASSIAGGGGFDTTRNLATDFELAKHLCQCGPDLPPFMIQSMLDQGFTEDELIAAGVPYTSIQDTRPIVDGDGNVYTTIKIDNDVWLRENLKTKTYNDGTPITYASSGVDWQIAGNSQIPAFCWPYGDDNNAMEFGALYNGYVVGAFTGQNKNVCPTGFRVASSSDFQEFNNNYPLAANAIASRDPNHHYPGRHLYATNESGFSAVGSSYRSIDGTFGPYLESYYFWNFDIQSGNRYKSGCFGQQQGVFINNLDGQGSGHSIRCIKYP